ncbi:MAG: hypothetical protein AAFQ51_18375, partial [Pseudomonadota bacterium]
MDAEVAERVAEAHALRDSGRLEDALECLEAALAARPYVPRLRHEWVALLQGLNAPERALERIRWFVELCPDAASTPLLIGVEARMHLQLDDPGQARACLDRAEVDAPILIATRARLLARTGGSPADRERLVRAAKTHSDRPDLVAEVASALANMGDASAALSLLDQAPALAAHPGAAALRARLALDRNDLAGAHEAVARVGAEGLTRPNFVVVHAQVLRATDRWVEARGVLDAALARHPGSVPLHQESWRLRVVAEGRAAVERDLEAAADGLAGNFDGLARAAQFAATVGAHHLADRLMGKADALDPGSDALRLAWAEVLLPRQDADAALTLLDAVSAPLRARDRWARLRARALIAAGLMADALDLLMTRCAEEAAATDLLFLLASVQTALGGFAEAEATLVRVTPTNGAQRERHLSARAQIANERGEDALAYALAEEGVADHPRSAEAWTLLARRALLAGHLDRAWEAHQLSLERARHVPQRADQRERALHSLVGQLVNEARLLVGAATLLEWAARLGTPDAAKVFRAKVAAEPHNTTAALHVFKALQNAGAVRDEPGPVR